MAGRKRHLLVDTLGLILLAKVHAADVQDRDGARLLLAALRAFSTPSYTAQLSGIGNTTGVALLEVFDVP